MAQQQQLAAGGSGQAGGSEVLASQLLQLREVQEALAGSQAELSSLRVAYEEAVLSAGAAAVASQEDVVRLTTDIRSMQVGTLGGWGVWKKEASVPGTVAGW